jgi:hypothetical protein
MPMVILLALVVGIMTAVMLERQSAQSLTVQRQLHEYRDQHFSRGVREVVGQWTDTLAGQPIEKLIQDDGHILDIQAADGGWVAIYMFDGQGSALADLTGLLEQDRTDALGVLRALAPLAGDDPDPALLRSVGTIKISAASAPAQLLEALGNYASGSRNGRRFSDSLVKARSQQDLTHADIQTAESAADMTAEQRQIVDRILLTKPELWNMVIDVYKPGDKEPSVRYGGRFSPPGAGNNARVTTSLQTLGKFLSWEELPLRDDTGQ